jgi:hypothetical protein
LASLIGHAIIGFAIARAARLDKRGAALAVALSLLPDADVIAGYVAKRNGEAWHRAPWSHSAATVTVAGSVASASSWLFEAGRNGAPRYGKAMRSGALAAGIVASHLLLDSGLRNPWERRRRVRFKGLHHLPDVWRYHVANLPTDILYYSSLGLVFYGLYRCLESEGAFLSQHTSNPR